MGIKSVVAFASIIMAGLVMSPGDAALADVSAGTIVIQRTPTSLYAKHCASCHGKDGRSKTFKAKFNHARNLTEPGWQEAVSDERIFNSIANGRGKNMPSFSKKMSEAEIDSLVLFVRGMRSS